MGGTIMKWEELREEEFNGAIEKSGGLCVIPMGCSEKHGQHLPVGIDTMKCVNAVEEAAKLEDVVIFPSATWLGDVVCLKPEDDPKASRLHGYVCLNPHTLMTVLTELCEEIARNGFRKILIVNSHGGNVGFLNYFVRAYGYEKRDHAVMWTGLFTADTVGEAAFYKEISENRAKYPLITDKDIEVMAGFAKTGYGGGHGDFKETAMLMSFRPDLVAEDKYEAESGLSIHRADHLTSLGVNAGFTWPSDYPNAYNGYPPHGCTQSLGLAMRKICAERLARIFKTIKEDEDCVRMAMRLPKIEN